MCEAICGHDNPPLYTCGKPIFSKKMLYNRIDKKFDKTEYFCHYHSMICYRCIVNKVRRPMYDLSGNFKSACTFHWLDYDFVCDECRIDIPPSDIITCTSCDNDFIGTFVEIPYHGCDDNIKYPGFD